MVKYLRAYLRAFWDLSRAALLLYLVTYPIWHYKGLVALYLGYLVVVSSLAGPVKVLMGK